MAEYWALDTGDPFASGLQIGCMFDRPNLTDQILNFSSPFTLTEIGTPTRPLVDGKLAYRPASNGTTTDSALTFNDQWLTTLGRSKVPPFSLMYEVIFDKVLTDLYPSIFQIGNAGGSSGCYCYLASSTIHTVGFKDWTGGDLRDTITIDARHRVIVTTYDDGGEYKHRISFDGNRQAGNVYWWNPDDDVAEIGRAFAGNPGKSLDGIITDFFMWDRVFTDQELTDLEADARRFLIPPSAVVPPTQNALFHAGNF